MKDQFCVIFVFSVLLVSTNEQCPLSVGNNIITSCRGPRKYGTNIYIDFFAFSHPCTCTVLPSFAGQLLIASREVTNDCKTHIIVKSTQTKIIFGCEIPSFITQTLNVNINQSVEVRAEYISPYTSGTFHHCVGFQQNGGLNGNVSIVCGSQLAAETTTMKISTTTSSSTTRLSSPTTAVLSMEPTSAFNITNANIINTTAATLLEGCICGHQIDAKFESLVSLRISLAIFVVISTISTIINIYFFIKNILRNKSKKDTTNIKTIHRGGNEPNIETYTELENAVSGDSENQYDSISRQENNINTNVL
nr:uncharacterized protein LOC105334390 isoform X2 [Crassostrea gigas]